MASANVTLGDAGYEFEADGTERTATLQTPGGVISNRGNDSSTGGKAGVNTDGGTVVLTEPAGASMAPLPVGSTVVLPSTCRSFTFKATASCMLVFTKR